MTVFDEAIVAGPAAAEGICVSCPFREAGPRVLGLEYARERARAEAAEARCEELRRAEVEARSVAGSLKWRLDKCRGELKAAGDEVKSVRRMAKNALALQAEVSRLEKLLSQAGVESGKRSTIMSLREENARLKKDVRAAKDRVGRIKLLERETGDLRFWLRGSHERLERIEARHRDEVDWLNKDIACLRSALGRSVDKRNGEMASLRKQFERRHAATVRKVAARDRTIAWLWNEFVARYHYLGYKTLVGAQMRYAVHGRDGWPVAMLGFSTAAWKLAPRDRFIGWTPKLREKNLPLVVDNPRFLILPWIEIPNLGSHILSLVRRRLPEDWTARYNTAPVLIETFVETPRYTGAVYKASGWIPVGTTQGRGRYDRDKLHGKPRKDIWLRPLRKNWKQTLNR